MHKLYVSSLIPRQTGNETSIEVDWLRSQFVIFTNGLTVILQTKDIYDGTISDS